MAWPTDPLGFARPGVRAKRDVGRLSDLSAASGSFHELTARLLLEHERILTINCELQAELARGQSLEASTEFAEQDLHDFATWEKATVLPLQEPSACWAQNVARWEPPGSAPCADASTQTTTNDTDSHVGEFGSMSKGLQADGCDSAKSSGFSGSAKRSRDLLGQMKPPRESVSSLGSGMSQIVRRLSSNGRPLPASMANLYLFLEDADSSMAALCYKFCMQVLLFGSVVTPLLQVLDPPVIPGRVGMVVETFFDALFTLELSTRFIVSPAPGIFFRNGFNIIDVFPVVTLVFRSVAVAEGTHPLGEDPIDAASIILLCLTPVMRLLKMLRRWDTMHLLTKAFADVFEALPVLLFPLFILTLTFATLIYIVEKESITTLPTALWLTIVTMTTVGYGDVVPKTTPGSLIVSTLVITSVMYMAMPVAIIGSSFTKVWQERASVMLMHRTRERLAQWGYTAHDVPQLFQMFGKEGNGGLSTREFIRMIKTLKLGLTDERILQLFKTFDTDSSGVIDDKEFVRSLYPNKFVELYGPRESEDTLVFLPSGGSEGLRVL